MLEVSHESVRRWRRVWEEGGTDALRRRTATGRPPKLDDAQVEQVRTALEQGAQAHGFEADLWTHRPRRGPGTAQGVLPRGTSGAGPGRNCPPTGAGPCVPGSPNRTG
ncbi:helix-turn-helix domain-containing protein [Streptomyces sp. NPDC001739]